MLFDSVVDIYFNDAHTFIAFCDALHMLFISHVFRVSFAVRAS
jgi:hypothetical protein